MLGCNLAIDFYPFWGGGGGVEIFLITLCYRNLDKVWSGGQLALYVNLTFIQLIYNV